MNFELSYRSCCTPEDVLHSVRNKVVKIPPSVNDLSFLRNVVERTFLKVEESHGGANVYFQKYNTEWEERVDDEDFVAETKDKLKVVVTSTLVTGLGTVTEREEEDLEMSPRTGTAITISENSSNPVRSMCE